MKVLLKISAVILFLLALTAGGTYLWFIRHAEELVRQFLLQESNGSIDLTTKKATYAYRTHRLTLTDNTFAARPGKDAEHRISAQRIVLWLGPIARIIRERRLLVDSIRVDGARVAIRKTRPSNRREISLPEELGRIYNLLERSLKNLSIQTFEVTDGGFRLERGYDSPTPPVNINAIRLRIEGLHIPAGKDRDRFLHSDRIIVETGRQRILLPDGYHRLAFRSIRLDTRDGLITLDSCQLSDLRNARSPARFDIEVDTLQFRHLDLALLARNNQLQADTAICLRPEIRLTFDLKTPAETASAAGRRRLQQSIETAVRQMTGDLAIGHIQVSKADLDLKTARNGRRSRFQTAGSDFTIDDLRIPRATHEPLSIGRFDFEIRNYVGYSSDSLYTIRFDSVQLRDQTVSLGRFVVQSTARNRETGWKEIRMKAFELKGIFWPALIFDDRIQAHVATLVEPSIKLQAGGSEASRKKNKGAFFPALNGFRRILEMDSLLIRNGSVSLRSENGASLDLNGFNSGIDIRAFLSSSNPSDLMGSLNGFSFADGTLANSEERITLLTGRYIRPLQQLTLTEASYRNLRDPLVISARGLVLDEAERTADNRFKASNVSWEAAEIRMDRSGNRVKPDNRRAPLLIGWKKTRGLRTSLDITSGQTSVRTTVDQLHTGAVNISTDGKPEIEDIALEGHDLRLELARARSRIGRYALVDGKTSRLEDIEVYFPLGDRRISATIPRLTLEADLGSFLEEKPAIERILLEQPAFNWEQMRAGLPASHRRIPDFSVGRLEISQAVFPSEPLRIQEDMRLLWAAPDWQIQEIQVKDGHLSASQVDVGWDSLRIDKGILTFSATNTSHRPAIFNKLSFLAGLPGQPGTWAAMLNTLTVDHVNRVDRSMPEKDRAINTLELDGLQVKQLRLGSDTRMDAATLASRQPELNGHVARIKRSNATHVLDISEIDWTQSDRRLSWEAFSYLPRLEKQSFTRTLTYQQDHISFRSGTGKAAGLDLAGYLQGDILRIRSLEATATDMFFFRDRTLPVRPDIIKPLPAALLQRINLPFVIDSLRIRNGNISYEEINDRTEKTGFVHLTHTDAQLLNVRTTKISGTDSFSVSLRTRLMDTASLYVSYRQSYADTLHGFLLSVGIGRFGMPALNPLLEPIASARIRRGYLDTIIMQATGNEYRAYGRMNMYYRDLNVQFLNRNDYERKTILTRLANLAANTILRKANIKRSGFIYAERTREKGFPNYWIRITLNGILTNAGIRSSSRQERRLRRSLNSGQLPSPMLK